MPPGKNDIQGGPSMSLDVHGEGWALVQWMTKFTGAVAWGNIGNCLLGTRRTCWKPLCWAPVQLTGVPAEAPAEFSGEPPIGILLSLAEG